MNQPPPVLNLPTPGNAIAMVAPAGFSAVDGGAFAEAFQQAIAALLGSSGATLAPVSEAELSKLTAGLVVNANAVAPPVPQGALPEIEFADPAESLPVDRLPKFSIPIAENAPIDLAALLAASQERTAPAALPSSNEVVTGNVVLNNLFGAPIGPHMRPTFELPAERIEPEIDVPSGAESVMEKKQPVPAIVATEPATPTNPVNLAHFDVPVPWHASFEVFRDLPRELPAPPPVEHVADSSALWAPSRGIPVSLLPHDARVPAMPIIVEEPRASSPSVEIGHRVMAIANPELQLVERSAPIANEDRNAASLAASDRTEFVTRMTEALQRAHSQMPKSLELELDPPALGKVHIQVVEHEGVLTARIETSSPSVRSMLLDHLPILDGNLAEHGIRLERMHVEHVPASTNGQAAGGTAGQSGQQAQQQHQAARQPSTWGWFLDEELAKSATSSLGIGDLLKLASGMDRVI